jgi:lipoprotein-anchoring transpeptidase ErfK/SrfK
MIAATCRPAISNRSRSLCSRQSIRRQQQAPTVSSKLVLHLLVGAVALLSAQTITSTTVMTSTRVPGGALIAYAEQSTGTTSTVSAPALSSGPSSTASTARTTPSNASTSEGVMGDLSATMGRRVEPGLTSWRGVAGAEVNLRSKPNRSKPPVGTLKAGTPVEVVRWVTGEEVETANDTWAELADGTYVFSTSLRRLPTTAAPALPEGAPTEGRWVDVNLTEQIATAYDGREVVRIALVSTGRPGWETPVGTFPVLRRVEKDTMDGSTLVGQGPRGTGADYKVENVRYVQYFTNDGGAIHENYWRRPATFGMPGSHGCIGMTPADAAWFWQFATTGTPLVIHE